MLSGGNMLHWLTMYGVAVWDPGAVLPLCSSCLEAILFYQCAQCVVDYLLCVKACADQGWYATAAGTTATMTGSTTATAAAGRQGHVGATTGQGVDMTGQGEATTVSVASLRPLVSMPQACPCTCFVFVFAQNVALEQLCRLL